VRVEANSAAASVTVKVKGTNPSASEVGQYLALKGNSAGFDKISEHESNFIQFNTKAEHRRRTEALR
jgi:hypothetical protein